nr:MAG TPA: hypothetical protein [Caudoviricetes sp.]
MRILIKLIPLAERLILMSICKKALYLIVYLILLLAMTM